MTEAQSTLVKAVKAHAEAHYEDGGWDVIVECWEDKDILEGIDGATTLDGAIAALAPVVSVWAERQADADYHIRQATNDTEENNWHKFRD